MYFQCNGTALHETTLVRSAPAPPSKQLSWELQGWIKRIKDGAQAWITTQYWTLAPPSLTRGQHAIKHHAGVSNNTTGYDPTTNTAPAATHGRRNTRNTSLKVGTAEHAHWHACTSLDFRKVMFQMNWRRRQCKQGASTTFTHIHTYKILVSRRELMLRINWMRCAGKEHHSITTKQIVRRFGGKTT